ncbi:unnamed protein product [Mytilus coruscus]|uniref:C-type lectin domain-containing protein n=1 Tax=Mytilus coruscus TaxID=42192 RepID=A0A6J8EQG3_MYTCO|nr:unnamed protein product [Mytilus coruscus]
MMVKYNKLYLLIIVALLSISAYKAQIIPGRNPIDQQPEIFIIDDSGARETLFVDGTGFGTGSAFGLLPITFLTIALLMIPMAMMPMMSTVTSETTPCVPTNCPATYRLLTDQTASPNCYFDSGDSKQTWSDALKTCTSTPGAYLWRPNTEAEANAVKNTFGFANDIDIWTGANSPTHDGNYVFAVDNGAFSFTSVPFGERASSITNLDCVEIELTDSNNWNWDDDECNDEYRFICEFPRKVCTKTPGAYLWRPNDITEADAVRSTFGFGTDVDIWIGAHSPFHDGNFVYAVDNGALSLTNLPFGCLFDISEEDCVEIEVNSSNVWEWDDEGCNDNIRNICELPRTVQERTILNDYN